MKQIQTTLDEYVYTSDDVVMVGEVEVGTRYVEADFNKIIEIKEREAHRVKLFMDQIDQREKTLVFCANQEHAMMVAEFIATIQRIEAAENFGNLSTPITKKAAILWRNEINGFEHRYGAADDETIARLMQQLTDKGS